MGSQMGSQIGSQMGGRMGGRTGTVFMLFFPAMLVGQAPGTGASGTGAPGTVDLQAAAEVPVAH